MASLTWKEKLGESVPADWGQEIDSFEAQIALRKQGTGRSIVGHLVLERRHWP